MDQVPKVKPRWTPNAAKKSNDAESAETQLKGDAMTAPDRVPPPPISPPAVAINTSSPRVARGAPRRRSKPWGWIIGLCVAFAGGLLVGLMIDRDSSRLPWTATTTTETPAAPAETPEQQAILAFIDEYLVQRDYQIVSYEELDLGALEGPDRATIITTVDTTTPAEGTQRFAIPFVVYTREDDKKFVLPCPEDEKDLELFKWHPGFRRGTTGPVGSLDNPP